MREIPGFNNTDTQNLNTLEFFRKRINNELPSSVSCDFQRFTNEGLNKYQFGPDYSVNTTKGKLIFIKTVINERPGRSLIELFGFNDEGKIVGQRSVNIVDQGNYIEASGTIKVGTKDEGFATAIDTALVDILRRKAAIMNHSIIWKIANANIKRIAHLKKLGASSEEIEKQETEQVRWMSVYGPNGRFHTKPCKEGDFDFEKEILPGADATDLEYIDSIALEQDKKTGFGTVIGVNLGDKNNLRAKKISEFAKIVLNFQNQFEQGA